MEAGEIWQILGLSRRAGQPATRAGEYLPLCFGFSGLGGTRWLRHGPATTSNSGVCG